MTENLSTTSAEDTTTPDTEVKTPGVDLVPASGTTKPDVEAVAGSAIAVAEVVIPYHAPRIDVSFPTDADTVLAYLAKNYQLIQRIDELALRSGSSSIQVCREHLAGAVHQMEGSVCALKLTDLMLASIVSMLKQANPRR